MNTVKTPPSQGLVDEWVKMAITGNEILTLQFGHYSNYIGAHWWNCQVSILQ